MAMLLASSPSALAIGFTAEEKYNSVFVVMSGNSLGSGFSVGKNCVVTNAHVIRNINNIVLQTYSGESHTAFLVGMDEDKDIAVLGVEGVEFSPLEIDDYSAMGTGDDVYAIGAPKSMAYTLTKGILSAKERQIGKYSYIQTDAAVNEGNSGGPLLNDEGHVLGMNTLKMLDSEGIGLAIPMAVVCEYMSSIGVELDSEGNVSAPVEQPAPEESAPVEPNESEIEQKYRANIERIRTFAIVGFSIATISIAGNIILAIKLVDQKQKREKTPSDPRERTDFDIDILE
jgi:serine protease Do